MATPFLYDPDFYKGSVAALAFNVMEADEHWITHENVPRRELYHNDRPVPYLYGKAEFARTYLPTPWNPIATLLREMIRDLHGIDYDVCFSNMYRNGKDQLGWHADDSPEMDDDYPIMIVSLYPDDKTLREIWFRPNLSNAACPVCSAKLGEAHGGSCAASVIDEREASKFRADSVEKLLLGNGSLVVMSAHMQETHEHRIPKSGHNECGARISLTFRKYKEV